MAVTMLQPPTALGCEPSYIRVMTAAYASLPPHLSSVLTLPDGSKVTKLAGASRIGPANYASMAQVRTTGEEVFTVDAFGDGPTPGQVKGWYFRGLRFQDGGSQQMTLNGYDDFTKRAGTRPWVPDHVLFDQCTRETDRADMGNGGTLALHFEGSYIGEINGLWDRFYSTKGGGDDKMMGCINGPGPVHFENIEFRGMGPVFFTGGDGSDAIGNLLSNWTYQFNWQVTPTEWRASEYSVGVNGVIVNIDADGVTVRRQSGFQWIPQGEYKFTPGPGAVLYDTATGKARRINRMLIWDTEGVGGVLELETNWGGAASGLKVGLQKAFPLLLYNSGLDTPMPTATTIVGSSTVELSAALPAACRAGHYFYLNNTHWQGDRTDLFTPWPTSAISNARGAHWGPGQVPGTDSSPGPVPPTGITRTQCKRKQILSIQTGLNGPRTRIILGRASAGDEGGYWESSTFPYSVVVSDGLHRTLRPKGLEETKVLSRGLFQGNVIDSGSGGITQHPTNQSMSNTVGQGSFFGRMDVVGNLMTVIPGSGTTLPSWWPNWVARRQTFGHPWPRLFVCRDFVYNLVSLREVESVAPDLMSAVLRPIDPNRTGQFSSPQINAPWVLFQSETPWFTCEHQIWRYNLGIGWGGGSSRHGSPNPGETALGKNSIHHDNVRVHNELMYGVIGTGPLLSFPTLAMDTALAHGGKRLDNGTVRYSHNTDISINRMAGPAALFAILEGPQPPPGPKATTNEVADNLITNVSVASVHFFSNTPHNSAIPASSVWDLPYIVARNVLAGTSAANTLAGLGATDPSLTDNSAVALIASLGLRNPAVAVSGDPGIYDSTNYIVDDVYATGTVTIAADGLSAALTSGTWPATVVVGQFFRTATDATLRKITGVEVSTVRWQGAAHAQAGQTLGYTIGFKNAGSDGKSPGADIDLLGQMIAGVRTRAIP